MEVKTWAELYSIQSIVLNTKKPNREVTLRSDCVETRANQPPASANAGGGEQADPSLHESGQYGREQGRRERGRILLSFPQSRGNTTGRTRDSQRHRCKKHDRAHPRVQN